MDQLRLYSGSQFISNSCTMCTKVLSYAQSFYIYTHSHSHIHANNLCLPAGPWTSQSLLYNSPCLISYTKLGNLKISIFDSTIKELIHLTATLKVSAVNYFYHLYNVQFLNVIENDKLSWEICSSKVVLFCILPFHFQFEGATGKTSLEVEVNSSKWLNRKN